MTSHCDMINRAENGDWRAGYALLGQLADFLEWNRQDEGTVVRVEMPKELADYAVTVLRRLEDSGGFVPSPLTLEALETLLENAPDVESALNLKRAAHGPPDDPVVAEAKSFLLAWSYHQEIQDPAEARRKAREEAIERSVEQAAQQDPHVDRATVRKVIRTALDRGEQPRRYPPVKMLGPGKAAKLRVAAKRGGGDSAVEKAYKAWRERLESDGDLGETARLVRGLAEELSEERRAAVRVAMADATKETLSKLRH